MVGANHTNTEREITVDKDNSWNKHQNNFE